MMQRWHSVSLLGAVLLTACASAPDGPTVLVLKGGAKTFPQFAQDDTLCRRFAALEARGAPPDQALLASGLAPTAATGLAPVPGSTSREMRQQLYDIGYAQCMDEKGHRVPVPGFAPEERLDTPLLPPPPMLRLPDEAE